VLRGGKYGKHWSKVPYLSQVEGFVTVSTSRRLGGPSGAGIKAWGKFANAGQEFGIVKFVRG